MCNHKSKTEGRQLLYFDEKIQFKIALKAASSSHIVSPGKLENTDFKEGISDGSDTSALPPDNIGKSDHCLTLRMTTGKTPAGDIYSYLPIRPQ